MVRSSMIGSLASHSRFERTAMRVSASRYRALERPCRRDMNGLKKEKTCGRDGKGRCARAVSSERREGGGRG